MSDGPSPRTTTFLAALPVMIKPPITTLSPVSTRARVDMFRALVGVAVGVAVGVGVGGWVGTTMPAENSEVFPSASVAVAVTMRPLATGTFRDALNETLPLASVVTLLKPRNCCPSAGRPSGSGSLAKNSIRNVEFGALPSVPAMFVVPPFDVAAVNTGKFWKLLGSLGAPWPLESFGVAPSSLG